MGNKPTIEQVCEFTRQIEAGRVTSRNFQLFLRNPDRFLEEAQPAITGGEVASSTMVVQNEPWTRSLSDTEVLARFGNCKLKSGKTVANLLSNVRAMFTSSDPSYSGPVVYHIRSGYTFKKSAPKEGLCWRDFDYLHHWSFFDDSGPERLVFSAPVVIPWVFGKNWTIMQKELRRLEKQFDLPRGFLSYGTLQTTSAVMLAGLRDQRVRVLELFFITETCLSSSARLSLHWLNQYLSCRQWNNDDNTYMYVGGLPQGIVVL